MPSVSFAGLEDGNVVVNAFVPTIVEDSGTCVTDLTAGGVTRSASAPARADATATWCDPLTVAVSDLSPGTWTGTVSYSSTTSSGRSDRFEVVIP